MATACSVRLQPPVPLIQIRKGYTARCQDFSFSIQSELDQWTLEVRRAGSFERLYRAHRSSARAAQAAAAEYASFLAPVSGPITWTECW